MFWLVMSWVLIVALFVLCIVMFSAMIAGMRDSDAPVAAKVLFGLLASLIVAAITFGSLETIRHSNTSVQYAATVTSVSVKTTNAHTSVRLDIVSDTDTSSVDKNVECQSSQTFRCTDLKRGDRVIVQKDYGLNGVYYHHFVNGRP